jgi:phosphohistidine phosphatase SixA/8-oxo-dGTP pyrophosphatase MutT (NUDIX family)
MAPFVEVSSTAITDERIQEVPIIDASPADSDLISLEDGAKMKSERAPYPAWIYRQSAVLPYRWHGGHLQVLLITSRRAKRWILPKGIVEPGFTAGASAAKEAREEAGIGGDTAEVPLGSYRYRKWGGTCDVEVYPFRVWSEMDEWAESGVRRRRWLSLPEALRRVEDEGLRTIIARLPDVAKPAHETRPVGRRPQASPSPRLIYLFRHAKSIQGVGDLEDFDRPLASRGELDCTIMARYVALADISPDLVLCSAALRARQTVQRSMPSLGDQAVVEYDRSLYLAEPAAIQEQLWRTATDVSSVMVVGHNPGIQSLAIRLTGSGDEVASVRLKKKFPAGAIAILVFRGRSWNELDTGRCELHSLVRPRDIGEKRKRKA